MGFALGLKGDQLKACGNLVENLYRMVVEKDMSLLEINPLVVTKDGKLICLDGKMNFDSNALYRHPEIVALRDLGEEDPTEIEASKHDLAFVKLDGNIGCLVNGAGLAMATMDIIKLYGAEPANFLDVGGGASKEKVQAAFKIILADPSRSKGSWSTFSGASCAVISSPRASSPPRARWISRFRSSSGSKARTSISAKKFLKESGLKIIPADDLADAAKKITDQLKNAA